eukprot:Sdes_comp18539_c0_seq1m8601
MSHKEENFSEPSRNFSPFRNNLTTNSSPPKFGASPANHDISAASSSENAAPLQKPAFVEAFTSDAHKTFPPKHRKKSSHDVSFHPPKALKVFSLCFLWYLFSACTNNIGKSILNQFPHPTTLCLVQAISISLVASLIMDILRLHKRQYISRESWIVLIFPLASGRLFGSIMSQMSIWRVPVSYAHTVKAVSPLFTVILSRIILGSRHPLQVYLSLVPIVLGVLLATVSEISFDFLGMICALASTLVFALQNIYAKKHMKDKRFDHLNLLLYTSSLSCVLVFPFWFFLDGVPLFFGEHNLWTFDISWLAPRLFANGLCNAGQSIVAFHVLSLISPVSYSVASSAKRIIVISFSILAFHNQVSWTNLTGMSLAIGGVAFYNKVKLNMLQRSALSASASASSLASSIYTNAKRRQDTFDYEPLENGRVVWGGSSVSSHLSHLPTSYRDLPVYSAKSGSFV